MHCVSYCPPRLMPAKLKRRQSDVIYRDFKLCSMTSRWRQSDECQIWPINAPVSCTAVGRARSPRARHSSFLIVRIVSACFRSGLRRYRWSEDAALLSLRRHGQHGVADGVERWGVENPRQSETKEILDVFGTFQLEHRGLVAIEGNVRFAVLSRTATLTIWP